MKIIESFRNLIRRIKIKKLDKPKEDENIVQSNEEIKKDALDYLRNVQIHEQSDNQKLEKILKMIGCEQVTINNMLENKRIDVSNLRENIQILNRFNYSNTELSLIIANNTAVLTMPNSELQTIISGLIKYFNNVDIVKKIVYANSKVLSKNGMKNLKKVKETFKKYEISLVEDYNLLVENQNILNMNDTRLDESLNVIKRFTNDINQLKSFIRMEPIVVGITNVNLLSEYV